MRYALSGWCSFYGERRRHKETQAAYDNLVVAHQKALRALQVEEQRAADAVLALTEDCPQCELLTRERNDALLELDNARADLEGLEKTLCWLEGNFFSGTRADGESAA